MDGLEEIKTKNLPSFCGDSESVSGVSDGNFGFDSAVEQNGYFLVRNEESGLFEKEPDDENESAYDRTLVGMERYYTKTDIYDGDDERLVREYVLADDDRTVWSTTDGPPGFRADAEKHGHFDDTKDPANDDAKYITMDSVLHMLKSE